MRWDCGSRSILTFHLNCYLFKRQVAQTNRLTVPRIKFTKTAIDTNPTPTADVVYWDAGCPGFGMKVTPKGRKVFL